jgi:uncharacterized OB-fold protein
MSSQDWVVRQKIEIPFRYTAGPALERFFAGLRDAVLVASACSGCGRRSLPPLSFCGRCWRPITEYVELSGQGTLLSFARVPFPVTELPELTPPVIYGLFDLEGAETHLAHLLSPDDADALGVGAPVEVVWREQRTGTILDIRCFRLRRTAYPRE